MLHIFIFVLYEIFLAYGVLLLHAGCKMFLMCCNFSAHGTCSGILCNIFPCVERALVLLCYFFTHGTRSGIIVLFFPRVERALALSCYIFSACGKCSGIIVLYFPRIERALVFCVKLIFVVIYLHYFSLIFPFPLV